MEITGLVTTIWVLSLPKTMHMVFTESLSASAVIARSIKVLGWQLGAAKSREHEFTKKRSYCFSKFIGPVTSIWVLSLPETVHMVLTKRFPTSAVFERSIRFLGWQLGTAKVRDQDFPRKTSWLIGNHRTSDNHMGTAAPFNRAYGLYGASISQDHVCEVNKSAWMATEGRKTPGAGFSKKRSQFSEIPCASGTSLGTAALSNCPYGLYGMFTNQNQICKVNRSPWMTNRGRKMREHGFPKKRS